MRRFVFKLQPVLDQRLREEERRQRAVAEIERKRFELEGRIRKYQIAIIAAKQDLRDQLRAERAAGAAGSGGGGVALHAVKMQANASLHLVAKAQQAVFELAGVHKHLDAARVELLQATTARKAVELLKDRRYQQWKLERARKEAADADELNVMRHGRNKENAA
jgi:flagellar FliJ protein